MAKLTGTWAYTRGQEELQTRLRKLQEEKDLILNLLDHTIDRMNLMVVRTAGITNINQFMHQFQDATIAMNQTFLKLFKIHILLTDEEYMDAPAHTQQVLSQMSIAYPGSTDAAHGTASQRVIFTVHDVHSPDSNAGVVHDQSGPLQEIITVCSSSAGTTTSTVTGSIDSPIGQILIPTLVEQETPTTSTSPSTQRSSASPVTTQIPTNLSHLTVTELSSPLSKDVDDGTKVQLQNAASTLPSAMTIGEQKSSTAPDGPSNVQKNVLAGDNGTGFGREKIEAEMYLNSSVDQVSIPRAPRTQPRCAAKPPPSLISQEGAVSNKPPVRPPEGVSAPTFVGSSTFLMIPPAVVHVTGRPVDVVLSHYKSPNEFWLQLKSSKDTLQMLLDCLHKTYSTKAPNPNFEIKIGMYCVAHYPVDSYWYRAKVLQVQQGHVKVSYIDFGNYERVEKHNVHPLDESLGSIPAQAICCAIKGIKPIGNQAMWDQQAVQTFRNKIQGDVSLRATFYEQDPIKGRYAVELLADSNGANDRVTLNLAEHFVSLRLAEEAECLDEIPSAPGYNSSSNNGPVSRTAPQFPPGPILSTNVPPPEHPEGNFLVTLSVVFSPSDFFGQVMDRNSVQSIERLQEQLNEYGPNADAVNEAHVAPGSHWVCLYSTDKHWYRVRVLDVVPESQQLKFKVFYIDYGNRGTVTAADLRPLTAELARLPAFALHMALAIVSPVGEHWSQAANQLFVEKTGFDDSLFAEQKKQRKDHLGVVTEVVLWNRRNPRAGINVNIFLVENNLAVIKQ